MIRFSNDTWITNTNVSSKLLYMGILTDRQFRQEGVPQGDNRKTQWAGPALLFLSLYYILSRAVMRKRSVYIPQLSMRRDFCLLF